MQEKYERIARQVNETIGSGLTAEMVLYVEAYGITAVPQTPTNLDRAAYWLALHLLNGE